MYRSVSFSSTFPNEWVLDADENPVAPGARKLADAIVAKLREHVTSVTVVEQHEYYGWGFSAKFERSNFYNVLNPAEVACNYPTVKMDWYRMQALLLRRPKETSQRYCAAVDQALLQIPEISAIEWQPHTQ